MLKMKQEKQQKPALIRTTIEQMNQINNDTQQLFLININVKYVKIK